MDWNEARYEHLGFLISWWQKRRRAGWKIFNHGVLRGIVHFFTAPVPFAYSSFVIRL